MKNLSLIIRFCIFIFSFLVLVKCTSSKAEQETSSIQESYSCTPCGQSCDKVIHRSEGQELESKLGLLDKYKDQKIIIVHIAGGVRAQVTFLAKMGLSM